MSATSLIKEYHRREVTKVLGLRLDISENEISQINSQVSASSLVKQNVGLQII